MRAARHAMLDTSWPALLRLGTLCAIERAEEARKPKVFDQGDGRYIVTWDEMGSSQDWAPARALVG